MANLPNQDTLNWLLDQCATSTVTQRLFQENQQTRSKAASSQPIGRPRPPVAKFQWPTSSLLFVTCVRYRLITICLYLIPSPPLPSTQKIRMVSSLYLAQPTIYAKFPPILGHFSKVIRLYFWFRDRSCNREIPHTVDFTVLAFAKNQMWGHNAMPCRTKSAVAECEEEIRKDRPEDGVWGVYTVRKYMYRP